MYNGNGFKMVACDFYCEHGWPPNTNFGTRKWWTRKYVTPLWNMICFLCPLQSLPSFEEKERDPMQHSYSWNATPSITHQRTWHHIPFENLFLEWLNTTKGECAFESTAFILEEEAFADVRSILAHFCFLIVCYFWSWCLRRVDISVCLCVRCTSLSVCLWLALRDGVLSCTSCWCWWLSGYSSLSLCLFLGLVVLGALVQLDAGWKGVFTAEAKWESRPPPGQPPQPLIQHTTTLRLIFKPIQIFVFVFVFQIHQCLTQIFEKQPSAQISKSKYWQKYFWKK